MRKSISLMMLGLILTGSVLDLHDLAKIPRLIEHFQEHRKKSEQVSFLDFINLHYGSEAERHDKEEHAQHTGLPFKSPDCTFSHTVTLLPDFTAPGISSLIAGVTYSNFYQSAFSTAFCQSIWQPPRISA